MLDYFLSQPFSLCFQPKLNIIRGFHVIFLATRSVHIPPVKNTEVKICLTKLSSKNRRQKTAEVRIPLFNETGKRKTKIQVRIPFVNEKVKRKTKIEVRIPFFNEAGKRK